MRTAIALTLVLASLLPAPPAGARSVAGVAMPDSVRVERRLLRLNGMALYRKVGFPVLVAGLYLSDPESRPARILASDSPRRYVTHFVRRVSAKRVCDAWRKGLEDNTPGASVEVRAQFRTLCHWIRDFRAGDEITVTYLPARGCEVEIGGKRVGVIPGKAFADAYFALVLGPRPSLGDKFKGRLLGR
jgi:hypothetical protein